ncbi:HNH endonuclease signature motif containing protein [Tepidanaerobacter syntrophicus]|uniref:HNH endonuclease signature motif containing protein n=1 Tax=Tepidanaerobacter syntrophicus TaxID=224999 RepID=UPI0023A83C93|nr:HNH endonuclease signature motif containing protein [Tepidanaerobacter syntrophicus]
MKPWAESFYKSKAWHKCREAYIAARQGLCERCAAQGVIRAGEIVHHKEWLTPSNINDPSITLNFDNLELLCMDCHNKEHRKQLPISNEIVFDEYGNVVTPPMKKKIFSCWAPGRGAPKTPE